MSTPTPLPELDDHYLLDPIDRAAADRLRARGGPVLVADAHPGYPCRQCLRDARVGDELVLVSYDPFEGDSPYRAPTAIFLHRRDCGTPEPGPALPAQLARRRLAVRAYDAAQMMTAARLVDGADLPGTVHELFQDSAVQRVDLHNAARGCWAASVRRAPADPPETGSSCAVRS
ncbi:MAG: DUF1203 domain-containing protein [Actinomycetales bacterium]|nr:DUF1203 domain-containing protein [Actinomycetales bacterium]